VALNNDGSANAVRKGSSKAEDDSES
jgi:hypothetical protein